MQKFQNWRINETVTYCLSRKNSCVFVADTLEVYSYKQSSSNITLMNMIFLL